LYERGMAYRISDGIYFDTKAYEKLGNTYGELSSLAEIKEGARVEVNPEKKDKRDFALWKFSPKDVKRQMEWESPWGMGFPGWHIECSAMSTKYLGEQFDIHGGGEDLRSTHHPNEIAQAEGASGKKPFVKYWVHGAFLLVNGGRMGKSLGNAYTLADIKEKSIDALALRYFYMTGHYRKQLNFTWEGLGAAATALDQLRELAYRLSHETERNELTPEKMTKLEEYRQRFTAALTNDLNVPEALAVTWEMVKSNIPARDRYELLVNFDTVLGFNLAAWKPRRAVIPPAVQALVVAREQARKQKDFSAADELRKQILVAGFVVRDEPGGAVVEKA
jgi:cysteinyl-tRNA synthetase